MKKRSLSKKHLLINITVEKLHLFLKNRLKKFLVILILNILKVYQIVTKEIAAIESDNFNKKMLLDIYNEL